jgi:hypothetical protein
MAFLKILANHFKVVINELGFSNIVKIHQGLF